MGGSPPRPRGCISADRKKVDSTQSCGRRVGGDTKMEGGGRDPAQLLISWGELLLAWLGSALCYNQARGGSGMSREHPQEMCSYRATLAGRPRGPHRRGGSPHGPASGLAAVTSGTGSDTSGGTASFLE